VVQARAIPACSPGNSSRAAGPRSRDECGVDPMPKVGDLPAHRAVREEVGKTAAPNVEPAWKA
jgi:hypothetical protein